MVGNVDSHGTQALTKVVSHLFFFFFKHCESQAKYISRLDSAQEFATYTLRKHLSGETILSFKCQDVLSAMLSLPTKLYTELGGFPFRPSQTFCGYLPI